MTAAFDDAEVGHMLAQGPKDGAQTGLTRDRFAPTPENARLASFCLGASPHGLTWGPQGQAAWAGRRPPMTLSSGGALVLVLQACCKLSDASCKLPAILPRVCLHLSASGKAETNKQKDRSHLEPASQPRPNGIVACGQRIPWSCGHARLIPGAAYGHAANV